VLSRRRAAALIAAVCIAWPPAHAEAAPDGYLALQGLLTGDKQINDLLNEEFQRGYGNGLRVGQAQDNKPSVNSDKAKAPSKKLDRAFSEAYKRGFNLGRQEKALENEKSTKSRDGVPLRSGKSP
jgi:hypothetical protein